MEELLYLKLINNVRFQSFVRKIYRKVNSIPDLTHQEKITAFQYLYKPTRVHKFKAFKILFWDEIRATLGFKRQAEKFFK